MYVHIEDFGHRYFAARRRAEQLRTAGRCMVTGKIIKIPVDDYADPVEVDDDVHWRVIWREP